MPAPVPGTVVSSGSAVGPGGDTGLSGPNGPSAVSTDANNLATLGSDNLISVPASNIWSMRLRSFNSVGNPNFEVDQRTAGNGVVIPVGAVNPFAQDRWQFSHNVSGTGTRTYQVGQGNATTPPQVVPGTNFQVSSKTFYITLTAQQASIAAGDVDFVLQVIEGPNLRELINDVHSISVLARTNVTGGLKFALALRDPAPATQSLVKLCTLTAPNVWQLLTFPNLPVFPSSGNFSILSGAAGYALSVCVLSGSTYMAPATDVWQNGNFIGAPGMDNLASKPSGSYLYIAFVQHEPGAICTTPQDKPFNQNLWECLRYYEKTYGYAVKPGTVTNTGIIQAFVPAGGVNPIVPIRFKQIMATYPTVTGYNSATGASNSVRDATNSADRAISSTAALGDGGFGGFNVTGGASTIWQTLFHYTADTAW